MLNLPGMTVYQQGTEADFYFYPAQGTTVLLVWLHISFVEGGIRTDCVQTTR